MVFHRKAFITVLKHNDSCHGQMSLFPLHPLPFDIMFLLVFRFSRELSTHKDLSYVAPSAQCRAVCSIQGSKFNASPLAQCSAVSSMQGI